MARYQIIVNPAAGRGAGEQAFVRLGPLLKASGIDFDMVRTERPMHAAELACQAAADGFDCVVAVGGDGTSNEVLNGLMAARLSAAHVSAMGMISVGRGNDFAFGAGIPPGLEEGCRVLAEGRRRTIDVGRVSGGDYPAGRYFGNGVGIGFDAVVGFEAKKLTWLSGYPSYLVAVLKTIFLYYRAPLLRIEYAGQALTHKALLVSIMNGRRMGGGFFMAPAGQPDDGLLDLCIAQEVRRGRIFTLIPHFLRGTQESQPEIRTAQTQRITVTALEGSLPAHADGETLCTAGQRLDIELLPGQIEMITASASPRPSQATRSAA